ncbi:MAG: substrate-binding domain-containing protein, partial [Orrella sp.]
VDGMVLVVRNPSKSKGLSQLKRQSVPYVLAYNQHPRHRCVGVDGKNEVAAAVKRLYELGHRRIAMVSGKLNASDRAHQRYQGYLAGMQSMQLAQLPLIEVDFLSSDMPMLVTCLTSNPSKRPTALICSNDLLALRSIRVAHQCGLSVPNTLSVVGFDGIAIGRELSPMLTTVIQPNHDIGLQATALLLESLNKQPNDQKPVTLTLKCGFRIGETVCSPPTNRSHLE